MELSEIEIWLVSDELSEGVLYRAYPSGRPASVPVGQNKSTPANYDIVLAAFSSGLTIVENDCRDSRLIPEAWVTEFHLKSCLSAPIMVGDRAVGVLRLDDTRRFNRFRPDDTEFIKLVSQIMATALEAARLFAQMKSSEQRFSQLVEASSVGIAIVRDRMLEFANTAFQDMLELADSPISSLSIFELIPSEQEAAWRRAFETVEEGRGDQRLEGWMQRPDGNRIWCEVFISSISYGGLRAMQIMVDDITEKKAIQAQRQNDLRVRSIGTLTAGIGQDFQALFSVILGHTAYLKMKGIDSDAAGRSILAVEAAVMRALEFTRQLLTFAETSEGGMSPLDVNGLIVQAARLHEGIVPERPRMKFDLASNLAKVRGNEEQLRQALLNLLLGFSERAGEGNLVVIQSLEELVDEEWARENRDLEPGSYVSVLFSDRRGVVDGDTAEALLSTSGTSMGRGTLGMSVLLSTVKTHQGAVEVRRGGSATMIALMLPVDTGMPSSPGVRLLSGTTPGAQGGGQNG
jgi:PAS domain S-box-containing protein